MPLVFLFLRHDRKQRLPAEDFFAGHARQHVAANQVELARQLKRPALEVPYASEGSFFSSSASSLIPDTRRQASKMRSSTSPRTFPTASASLS